MRNIYLMIFMSFSLLLVACNKEIVQESDQKTDKEIRYAKLLTKEEVDEAREAKTTKTIKKELQDKEKGTAKQGDMDEIVAIVQKSLSDIEEKMPNYWNDAKGGHALQAIDKIDINRPNQDTVEQKRLLKDAEQRLQSEFAKKNIEKLSRYFLIYGHSSMHKDYVHNGDLHARFSVGNETENSFDFTFITVEDPDAGFAIPGWTTLSYEYDGEKWRLADIEQVFPNEKPLNITFNDLEEFYDRYTNGSASFRPLDEEKVNGVTYLTYQLDDRTITRNAETSMIEYNN